MASQEARRRTMGACGSVAAEGRAPCHRIAPAVKRRLAQRPAARRLSNAAIRAKRPRHDQHDPHRPQPLLARRPAAPLAGTLRVPGDKSICHRALMFGALAVGETRITGLLEGEDVLRTAAAMRALGADVIQDADGALARRRARRRRAGASRRTCSTWAIPAPRRGCWPASWPAIRSFSVMTGDASLRGRPMRRVTEPLAACGARFTARDGGRLPLAIEGARDALPLDYRAAGGLGAGEVGACCCAA